eukprot:CAMPEP_0201908462 /NCGR_PEP_ID=MMETSP0903-20130614/574_1 /ASSEMBLY_ACC=CAM_ASM_000552 /TAXON_ID=420261 /ORGANISM="Thalassiosira antarctica, Strain CCMP982" /LENGTH=220 /DNA_ID=CAMNT_0048442813 /DNA_START=14 /DNA_END=673 /DNA_ORIENTATION=+
MGRATTSRSSARSSNNNRPFTSPITSEFDPAFPANLKRSLSRNDVELAALSKLHVALRTLKKAIVEEFGEERLLQCVLDEGKRLPVGVRNSGGGGSVVSENNGAKKNNEQGAITVTASSAEQAESEDESSNNDNDESIIEKTEQDTKQKRLEQLTTAFLLRMKLRRRLLNRLARRLHRVSHVMDGGSNISAPLPPLYGDVVRRYITEESETSGLAVRILG